MGIMKNGTARGETKRSLIGSMSFKITPQMVKGQSLPAISNCWRHIKTQNAFKCFQALNIPPVFERDQRFFEPYFARFRPDSLGKSLNKHSHILIAFLMLFLQGTQQNQADRSG